MAAAVLISDCRQVNSYLASLIGHIAEWRRVGKMVAWLIL